MLLKSLTHLLRDKKVSGLEAIQRQEGGWELRYVTLALAKGTVTIIEKGMFQDMGSASQKALGTYPTALVLNGRGILHKSVPKRAEESSGEQLLQTAMPAIKPADFYIQQYGSEKNTFVSLARRDLVDKLLEQLSQLGCRTIDIGFGPFGFSTIWPLLGKESDEANEVQLESVKLVLDNHRILDMELTALSSGSSFLVGDDQIGVEYILAYAAALGALVELPDQRVLSVERVQREKSENMHRRLFKAGALAALGGFFLVFLCNFLLFSQLSSHNSFLQAQLGSRSADLEQLTALERDVEEKRKFLSAAGWLVSPKLSFYADNLAASIPEGISLKEINVNPYNIKESRDQKTAVFEIGVITVKGACSNPLKLNEWLRVLGSEQWIRKVIDQSYAFDESRGEGKFEFIIQLEEGK